MFGQLTNLAFQTGKQQSFECIVRESFRGILDVDDPRAQILRCSIANSSGLPFKFDLQDILAFASIDRENAMGRNLSDRFAKREIIPKIFALFIGNPLDFVGDQGTNIPQSEAHRRSNIGHFGELFGENMSDAGQDVIGGVELLFGIDHPGQNFGQISHRFVGDFQTASASGSNPFSRASVASVRFLGL